MNPILSASEMVSLEEQVGSFAAIRKQDRLSRRNDAENELNQALTEFAELTHELTELEFRLSRGDRKVLRDIQRIGHRRNHLKNSEIPKLRAKFDSVQKQIKEEEDREPDVLKHRLSTLIDEELAKKRRTIQHELIKSKIKERERREEEARIRAIQLWNEQQEQERQRDQARAEEKRNLEEKERLERPQNIKAFVEARNINKLIHFTPGSNLQSIVELGLLSREALKVSGVQYRYTDRLRLDGWMDGLSLSIENKNDPMFNAKNSLRAGDWCILELQPAVLWEKDCAFFRTNASSTFLVRKTREDQRKFEALRQLFDSPLRRPLCPFNCPDDVQAEVMVFDGVEPKYIRTIFTNFNVSQDLVRRILGLGIQLIRKHEPFKTNRRDFVRR